jgi:asparagine synthase (glutamine-hydrolysing)
MAKRLSEDRDKPYALRAFTVDYAPLFADEEADYAEMAARHLGIPLKILSFADSLPYERWDAPDLPRPEPCHEPFLAAYVNQVRQESAHARVVLSGEGGDAILDGQAWPYLVYLVNRRETGALFREFGGFLLRHGRLPPLRGGFRTRLRRWLGRKDAEDDYPPWLNPAFERALGLEERWRELRAPAVSAHPFHPRAYASFTSAYWPSVFESEDAAWTRLPIEMRAPFLDLRLVRFLLRVPPVPWCAGKHLVRVAMRGQLPEEILRRPKTPLEVDPLIAHVRRKSWIPRAAETPVPGIEEFVDWPRVQAALSGGSEGTLWRDLRAISLNWWLKYRVEFSTVPQGA